jgi:hypothetical protein
MGVGLLRRGIALAAAASIVAAAGCGGKLPDGVTHFTVGRTVVRVDSTLDAIGVLWRMADSVTVAPRGPARHWLQALAPRLGDSVFQRARHVGLAPIALLLDTWAQPARRDTVCGLLAPGERRCFTGNEPMVARMRDFLDAARAYAPQTAGLELLDAAARHRDLEDVYVALTAAKALDSAVLAYSGYDDLTFDVTLARTLPTGRTSPSVDPAVPRAPDWRIFVAPDPVFAQRSFRSPTYIWLTLGHQMSHRAVDRLLAEHPELLERSIRLRPAIEGEMVRAGYSTTLWDEAFEEQLARAVTVRVLNAARPTLLWAARAEQLQSNMAIVPWLEDALARYEAGRARFRTLSDFAAELGAALDSIPLDSCRAAPFPQLALVGVDRHRSVVGWMAANSPFRARGLLVGDTVTAINGDSVSGGGLMVPSRQLNMAIGQNLPFELGILGIRRRGRDYDVSVPIQWTLRPIVRVASANVAAAAASGGAANACRWVTRVVRR